VNEVLIDAHRKATAAIRSAPAGPPSASCSPCPTASGAGGEAERDRYRRDMEDVYLEATAGTTSSACSATRARASARRHARPERGVRLTQMGYEFWPEALEATIRRAWEMTRGVPILVTENGIGTGTTPSASSSSARARRRARLPRRRIDVRG